MAEREVRVEARAKVNVFLRVLGRREDGYHDLESLVVPIALADRITFRPAERGDVRLVVTGGVGHSVPADERNLVVVAARLLSARCGGGGGALIELDKRIPAAAGLGGGSADAAATLDALNRLWRCDLGAAELAEVAAEVGSDVPALLHGGPVMVRGRGEIVEPAPTAGMWWVVVPQPFAISTADAYRWWDEDGGSTGPDPRPVLEAAARGDLDALATLAFNDLQGPVFRRHPHLEEARMELLRAGALAAILCGSGPTLVGLVRTRQHAAHVARGLPSAVAVSGPG
jgi:4-diphosphocytidyl-2-C-methyl-D-erythritol kinase